MIRQEARADIPFPTLFFWPWETGHLGPLTLITEGAKGGLSLQFGIEDCTDIVMVSSR